MNRRLNSLANNRVNNPPLQRRQGDHLSLSSASDDALFCRADGGPRRDRSGMNSNANKIIPQHKRLQTGIKLAPSLHRNSTDLHFTEKSAKANKNMSMKDFDQYQLAAIQFDVHRPLIITAGPGSGKTRTIVGRIVHMVQKCSIPGHKILALTFSREATQEMQNRLTSLAPDLPQVKTVTVKTFHAFCLRIMHNHADALQDSGLRAGFTLCANKDMKRIVRQSIEEWNLSREREEAVMQFGAANNPQRLRGSKQKLDPKDADKVLKWIQKQKAHGRTPSHFNQQQQSTYGWLFEDYERQLKKENLIDFSDMINKTTELLRRDHQIADHCSDRYQYILVDEFQDLSPIQFEVLQLISHQHGNVTICGDDDQSIYGFRGGSSKLFHSFRELFPNYTELNLEMNYRSSQHIVDSSMAVIIRNPNRSAKRQISVNREGGPLRLVPMNSEVDEVHWIVQEVDSMRKQGVPLSEIAILCRVRRNILQPFEQEFKKRDIPFIKSLRKTLSDRIVVDDIISYLSLIVDPYDNSSFVKIYNKPKRRLGEAVLNYLDAIHREQSHTVSNFSYLKAIELAQSSRNFRKAKSGEKINKGQQSALKALYDMTKSMYDFAGNADVEDVIMELLERIDLKSAIEKEKNQQSRARDARRYSALFEKERMKRTNGSLFNKHGAYNAGDDADDDDDDDDDEEFERDFEFEKNLDALKQEARYFCRKWLLEEEQGVDARANMERSDWITLSSVSSNANTNRRILNEFVGYMRTNDSFQLSDLHSNENDTAPEAVTISTIHQSKGLEWKKVFLVRCNERILPISIGFSECDPQESVDRGGVPDITLEEERRLMFVGMTRAKESLSISYIVDNDRAIPSRFIEDIPQENIQLVRRGSNGGGGVDCAKSQRSHYIGNLHSHIRVAGSSQASSVASLLNANPKRSNSTSGIIASNDRNKGKQHMLNSMQPILRPTSQCALPIPATSPKESKTTPLVRPTTPRLNSLAQKQSNNPHGNRSMSIDVRVGHDLNNPNSSNIRSHSGGGRVWRPGHGTELGTTQEELKLFREIDTHLSVDPRLSNTRLSSETTTQSGDGDRSEPSGPQGRSNKRRKTFVTHY